MTNARLIQAIREVIDAEIADLMEWGNQAEGVTLTDIEDRVLEARQRIGQTMMRALLEQQEERRNAEIPVNPETGKRLHPKGKKGAIVTRLGTITYKRAYYYDPHKRQGRYPLDEQLGIRGQLSAGLEREMVLLGA